MDTSIALETVELTVADLTRSVEYYREVAGLRVLDRHDGRTVLGVEQRPIVVLQERPGVAPAPPSSPGLSHFAIDVPVRTDVGLFAERNSEHGYEIDLRDHSVSRSCYVDDPDGHRIEVTTTTPRETWRWDGDFPVLVASPMELGELLDTAGTATGSSGLPEAAELGHVQLKATDIGLEASEHFYCDVLGFSPEARMGSGFLGVGVADYRSLVVLTDRFAQVGSAPLPDEAAQLLGVDLTLSSVDALEELSDRLVSADYSHALTDTGLTVRDPSGHQLRFAVGGPSA